VVGSCEHNNDPSDSIKGLGNFLTNLAYYSLASQEGLCSVESVSYA
jgi:hypothetical protein